MTAEERLRDLLRSEATTIVPGGDGLARIRERIARRRRLRIWLVPSAVLATAAAAAAFFLVAPDDHRTQTLQPGGTSTPTVTQTGTGEPTPVPGDDGGMPLDSAAIWPFTSQTQAASWQTTYPYADNGLQVGRHFVTDYLGLTGVSVTQSCVSCGVLALEVNGTSVGQITLATVGVGFASGHGTHVFTVTGVGGTDLTVTSPKAGAAVASPMTVTGRVTGVDEHVALRLLTDTGDELATGGAQAGSAVPWSATLSWARNDWTHGGIVGVTRSMRDGSVTRVVAIPVTRGSAAPASSFAALVDGHVSLFDGTSGTRIKQLTYPPAGQFDVSLAYSSGVLVWARSAASGSCGGSIDRLDAGTPSTLATSKTVRYMGLALSADGSRVAWLEQPCDGSPQTLVVRGGGAPDRLVQVEATWPGSIADVSSDGALLLNGVSPDGAHSTDLLLPVTAQRLSDAVTLAVDSSCNAGPTAWDGTVPVAVEGCSPNLRLARFDNTGKRLSAVSIPTSAERLGGLAMRDGIALLQLGMLHDFGSIATFDGHQLTTIVGNAACNGPSTDAKGCVGEPDW